MPDKLKEHVAWALVGYRFLYAIPYNTDAKQEKYWEASSDSKIHNSFDVDDMGIGWHIVFVECMTVLLLAGTLLFTLRNAKRNA